MELRQGMVLTSAEMTAHFKLWIVYKQMYLCKSGIL